VTQAQPEAEETVPFGQNGHVALRILGPLEVRDPSGREIRSVVAQPKRLALLSYLALTGRDQYRQRDTVVALFWPEFDQARARGALRQALSWLRHELGGAVLTTRGEEEIGVAASALWCDVVAFDDAVATGDLERAVALYRGPLLEGVFVTGADAEFERWLDAERARRHQQATRSAIALAEREGARGRLAAAVDWAGRAAYLSPNDEDVHRRRLRLLAASGDRAGALAAHAAFAERLAADYGTHPSAETARIVAEVQAGQGAAPPEVAAPASPIDRPPVTVAVPSAARARAFRPSLPAMVVLALALAGSVGISMMRGRSAGDAVAAASETTPPVRRRPPGDLAPSRTSSPRAYELLLRAAFFEAKRTREGFRQADALANQALDLDPLYADAWAVRAAIYQGYAWYSVMPANEAFLKSETAARRAVALDSTSGLGHAMLASALSFFRYRWADGEEEFRRAVALDPSNAQIRNFYSIHLRSLGRFAEALEQMRQAQDLDQLYRHYYWSAGWIQACSGNDAEAIAEFGRALQYDSAYTRARLTLAEALARQGRHDDAINEMQRAFTIASDSEKAAVRPATGGEAGLRELRRRIGAIDLRRLRERDARGDVVAPTEFADALLASGDYPGAIRELERAYAVRDPRLLILICPNYAEVRGDPRVRAIRQRMNLEPGTSRD
jgi:DNA-binding SARP family transcriptional activator